MQFKKHNPKTPPERKPKWLRKGIAVLAAIATLATGGIVASTAYAEDPGDTGGGNQDAAGGWAGLRRGGRPGVCDRGEGVGRRNAASRLCLSPIAGRTWACTRAGRLCSLFPPLGPEGSSPFPL